MKQRGVSMLETVLASVLAGIVGMYAWQSSRQTLDDINLTKEDVESNWLLTNAYEWLHSDIGSDTGGVSNPNMDTEANSLPIESQFLDYIQPAATGRGFRVWYDKGGYKNWCCGGYVLENHNICIEDMYLHVQFNRTATNMPGGHFWWLSNCGAPQMNRRGF